MDEKIQKAYFDNVSLKKFIEAEGKTIDSVICYLWQNNINKNDVIELIDSLELNFSDGSKITLGSNPENNGLEASEFDFKAEKAAIEKEFEGKIKLYAVNASATNMWKDVIGLKLVSVQISKDGSNYLSDSILLNFDTEKRTVSISQLDGLIIDLYEED